MWKRFGDELYFGCARSVIVRSTEGSASCNTFAGHGCVLNIMDAFKIKVNVEACRYIDKSTSEPEDGSICKQYVNVPFIGRSESNRRPTYNTRPHIRHT